MNYTACYCEENVWHLCANPVVPALEKKVIWVSSLQQVCPIWNQRSAASAGESVWWDYHVFLLARTSDSWQVWDLDSILGLPVDAAAYFAGSFSRSTPIQPVFRVMDSGYYRRVFASDRSHMKQTDGSWLATPPAWPVIGAAATTFTQMLDMHSDVHGELLSLDEIECLVSRADTIAPG